MATRLKTDLDRITTGIAHLRAVHALLRENVMAVEIKGLGMNVEAAMASIRNAKRAVALANSHGNMLASVATDLAKQFDQHTNNLLREASSLGNSPPPESDLADKLSKSAAEEIEVQPDPPKLAAKPVVADLAAMGVVIVPAAPDISARPIAGFETAHTVALKAAE